MATNKRSIGGAGLEQGGANLGNDYTAGTNNTTAGGSSVLPVTGQDPADYDNTTDNKKEQNNNTNEQEEGDSDDSE